MKAISNPTANDFGKSDIRPPGDNLKERVKPRKRSISRRSFLGKSLAVGAGTIGAGLLTSTRIAEASRGGLTTGDAALLRFAAAAEILEADFWIQYNELGGIQDPEVPGGTGNPLYTAALAVLDSDMAQYIHDNTDDEITHHSSSMHTWLANGAAPVKSRPVSHSDG